MPEKTFRSDRLGLFTDYYELLMAQGYLRGGRQEEQATFDYFFRSAPFGGGYVVFAGLHHLLGFLRELCFTRDELEYLRTAGLGEPFLEYLSSFRFQGTVRACREGEIVFPLEPVVTVSGNIIEVQLIEGGSVEWAELGRASRGHFRRHGPILLLGGGRRRQGAHRLL